MKLTFVTTYDSSDIGAWSGTIFNMREAFKASGVSVETIDNLADPYRGLFVAKRVINNLMLRRNYLRDREPLTLNSYARQVARRLLHSQSDVVFSPGTNAIAYLRTDKPIVFWSDATFDGMIDFYPEFTNLARGTIQRGHRMEQAALSNCRLAIYSSEWAAKTAIDNYAVDRSKIKVVPYGANLPHVPDNEEIRDAIASRGSCGCKLLFIGVDWNRKGGDDALLVASALNQQGLHAELHVVGCTPPARVPHFVKTYGYLSKRDKRQNELLSQLYRDCDFFILPSKAECAAVVIAEANAFALPVITTNVGGMSTVVRDEKNGRAFSPKSFVEESTNYILEILSSIERYHQLCESSREEYSSRLNWYSAVQSVLNLMASTGLSGK